MEVMQCDRCKAVFEINVAEKIKLNEIELEVNKIGIGVKPPKHSNLIITNQKYADICPKCAKDFERWFNKTTIESDKEKGE